MTDYLKDLCSIYGASGREDAVRNYIITKIDGKCDWHTDNLGNVIAFKKGKKSPENRVMLEAHMDEVGMVITSITSDGFLKFSFVGGVSEAVAVGRSVLVEENYVHGVIGLKVLHLTDKDEEKKIPSVDNLFIDIGAKSREEAEKLVCAGDYAYFDSDYVKYGDGFIKARALDDRAGCAILLKLIDEELEYDTFFAFNVQEETGLVGAVASAYSINPDYAIVVETTTAADINSVEGENRVCELGKGAVVSFMDGRTIYNRELYNLAFDIADKNGIKVQTKSKVAGGNDAGVITKNRCGVKTIAVSLPCRYLHSPSCVIKESDLFESYRLVKLLASEFGNR